jgi:NADH-quinone oxidoreductase subunit G
LHETAQTADVVLPAASSYEKNGTVTNTCGELQRLRKAMEVMGTRSDLEIIQRLASAIDPQYKTVLIEEILGEVQKMVPGYDVSLVSILSGGCEPVVPVNGHAPAVPSRLVQITPSVDTLFTSGTQGRYSSSLQSVPEKLTRKQPALA